MESWRRRSRNRSLDETKPPDVVWRSASEDNLSVVGKRQAHADRKVGILSRRIIKDNPRNRALVTSSQPKFIWIIPLLCPKFMYFHKIRHFLRSSPSWWT